MFSTSKNIHVNLLGLQYTKNELQSSLLSYTTGQQNHLDDFVKSLKLTRYSSHKNTSIKQPQFFQKNKILLKDLIPNSTYAFTEDIL
jgi:hypothetical protein